MSRKKKLSPEAESLPPEDRKIVNDFVMVFDKYKKLGPLRLAVLFDIAWTNTVGYNPKTKKYEVRNR